MARAPSIVSTKLWAAITIGVVPVLWAGLVGSAPGAYGELASWAYDAGALHSDLLLSQPWRLVTASLAHNGTNHLLTNSLTLLVTAALCTPLLGPHRVVWVAASTAWVGTFFAVVALPGWVLGASGAAYGLMACAGGTILRSGAPNALQQCLVLALCLGALQWTFGGDAWAHGAATLAGLCLGRLVSPWTVERERKAVFGVVCLATASCILTLFGVALLP